jgi:hypothetical protein
VGGVGDEALLAAGALVDALEHVVHRAREAGDLVVGVGDRHATVQVRAADVGDLGADRLDRAQRAADQPPDQRGEQHGDHWHADGERGDEHRDAVVDVLERTFDHDRDRSPRRVGASGVETRRAVAGGAGGGRDHLSVGVDDAGDHVVAEAGQRRWRRAAPGQFDEPVGGVREGLVEGLDEQGPLRHHQPGTGNEQDRGDRERRERGDAQAQGHRPHGTSRR